MRWQLHSDAGTQPVQQPHAAGSFGHAALSQHHYPRTPGHPKEGTLLPSISALLTQSTASVWNQLGEPASPRAQPLAAALLSREAMGRIHERREAGSLTRLLETLATGHVAVHQARPPSRVRRVSLKLLGISQAPQVPQCTRRPIRENT